MRKTITVAQHYTLHQLNEGLFIAEIKESKTKSKFYMGGTGVFTSLSELTFIKLYGMRMLKGDNNPANIHQHWILSHKGQKYINDNPF